jgi:hypothetical protein
MQGGAFQLHMDLEVFMSVRSKVGQCGAFVADAEVVMF